MKKKAKKTASKPKKASSKKPVVKKKPVPKAKKKKQASKKPVPKKKPVKKPVAKKMAKPVVKKAIAKKPVSKPVAKKVVKVIAKPAPVVKAAPPSAKPAKVAPTPAKPAPFKPTPQQILKLGLKPLPKPVPSQVKDEKKAKGYYTLEYMINSSPDILFDFVSTAGGLEKWFAEKVSVNDNIFEFSWESDENKKAQLIALKEREFARFHWLDQGEKKFFEFRIQIDDLTSEVALIVSDFADTPEELEDARLLWNAQIQDLLHALGGAP